MYTVRNGVSSEICTSPGNATDAVAQTKNRGTVPSRNA